MRREYIAEAEVVGSVPPARNVKGAASTAMQKLTGKNPEAFIDKLGCRLAFERTGVRLYDALIAKCSALGTACRDSPRYVWNFRNQELQHFKLVESSHALDWRGSDSTDALRRCRWGRIHGPDPSIDRSSHIGGAMPGSDSYRRIADNDAWQMLILFAEKMGMDEMARDFGVALSEEDIHLMHVRQWYQAWCSRTPPSVPK